MLAPNLSNLITTFKNSNKRQRIEKLSRKIWKRMQKNSQLLMKLSKITSKDRVNKHKREFKKRRKQKGMQRRQQR